MDTIAFYTDEIIKPGKLSPKDIYYYSFMLNEATTIKIAIIKYHTTNGKTVEIPTNHLKWYTFKK